MQNVTVPAGATAEILSTNVDLRNYDWIAVGVLPLVTHNYHVYIDHYGTTTPFSYAEQVISSASQNRKLSTRIQLRSLSAKIKVANNDIVSQTYTDMEVLGG